MPTPDAIAAALRFRAQLAKGEADAFQRMSTIYARIAVAIAKEFDALADEIAAANATGKILDRKKILRFGRLQRILRQIEDKVTEFGGTVANEVLLAQARSIALGETAAIELIDQSFPALPPETKRLLVGSLTRLPTDAIESAAGLLGDDSPLSVKLRRDFGQAVRDQVENHLLDGMGVGLNPRTIARQLTRNLESALGVGLNWAMTTVRTAQIKSYQLANHATYQANANIVPQWEWHAALDDRTCLSCIAKHGTLHPVTETLRDHHNGRCAPLPVPISYAALGITGVREPRRQTVTGRDWFAKQPQAKQRAMMGPARFDAWQANEFDFADLSRGYSDEVYGELFREASLKDLLGDKAKQYYAK
jgi:hypothetical protein